jgi:hypothetical protein
MERLADKNRQADARGLALAGLVSFEAEGRLAIVAPGCEGYSGKMWRLRNVR